MNQCKEHPEYDGTKCPDILCENCWSYYLDKKYDLKKADELRKRIQKFEKNNPGWTYGRRGPRQLGVYDG